MCYIPLQEQFNVHAKGLLDYIARELGAARSDLDRVLTEFVQAQIGQKQRWAWSFMERNGTMYLRTSSWNEGQHSALKSVGNLDGKTSLSSAGEEIDKVLISRHDKSQCHIADMSIRTPSAALSKQCEESLRVVLTTMPPSKQRKGLIEEYEDSKNLECHWISETVCEFERGADGWATRNTRHFKWMRRSRTMKRLMHNSTDETQAPWRAMVIPKRRPSVVKVKDGPDGKRLVCVAFRSSDGEQERACHFFRETGLPCQHVICANAGEITPAGIPLRWHTSFLQSSTPRSRDDLHLGLPMSIVAAARSATHDNQDMTFDSAHDDCFESECDDVMDTAEPATLTNFVAHVDDATNLWRTANQCTLPTALQKVRFCHLNDEASPIVRACSEQEDLVLKFLDLVDQLQSEHPVLQFALMDPSRPGSSGFHVLKKTTQSLAAVGARSEELTNVVQRFLTSIPVQTLESSATPVRGRGQAANCEPWRRGRRRGHRQYSGSPQSPPRAPSTVADSVAAVPTSAGRDIDGVGAGSGHDVVSVHVSARAEASEEEIANTRGEEIVLDAVVHGRTPAHLIGAASATETTAETRSVCVSGDSSATEAATGTSDEGGSRPGVRANIEAANDVTLLVTRTSGTTHEVCVCMQVCCMFAALQRGAPY